MAAQHPEVALSAFLDGALTPSERAAVEAHLASCGACRTELEELRGVGALLLELPERSPRRSLLPRRGVPLWLTPARWLSSVAAAVFALLFVASSLPMPVGMRSAAPAVFSNIGNNLTAPQAADPVSPAAQRVPAESGKYSDFATPTPALFQPAAGAQRAAVSESPRATPQPRGTTTSDRGAGLDVDERPRLPSWLWLVAAVAAGAIATSLTLRARAFRR